VTRGALRAVTSRLASVSTTTATRPNFFVALDRAAAHARPSFDIPARASPVPAWAPFSHACRLTARDAVRQAQLSFAACAGATRGLSGKAAKRVSSGKPLKASDSTPGTVPEAPPRAPARVEPPRVETPPNASLAVDGMPRFPEASVPGMLRLGDYVGTAIFAVTGSLAAAARGMDVLGATIVGTITAVGGGTVRDVLLGRGRRAFWMEEGEYLWICVASAGGAFLAWPYLETAFGIRESDRWIDQLDALGVGAFCVIGAQNGIRAGVPCAAAVACGMFTATFGGVIRDVLVNRPVRILHSYTDIYATAALAGASTYVLIRALGLPVSARIISGFSVAVGIRALARTYDWRLPTYAGWPESSPSEPTLSTRKPSSKRSTARKVDAAVGASIDAARAGPRVPSGAAAAKAKGDDGGGVRPPLAESVGLVFEKLGVSPAKPARGTERTTV